MQLAKATYQSPIPHVDQQKPTHGDGWEAPKRTDSGVAHAKSTKKRISDTNVDMHTRAALLLLDNVQWLRGGGAAEAAGGRGATPLQPP